jgi:hypothetical protein
MATFTSVDINTKARFMGGYGNVCETWGSVTPTAGASADIYKVVMIPAGVEVTDVDIVNDDLDSNGSPTIACKVGYTPVDSNDGPAASDAYFAASGKLFLNAAQRTALAFQPIKFEFPVYLIITLTASAATFASGQVTAIVRGLAAGRK